LQWHKKITAAGLLLLAVLLAATNVWIAADRSTIPREIHSLVQRTEIRKEKHPGQDDVYLLVLKPTQVLQVDGPVYARIVAGAKIEKREWARELTVDGVEVSLGWSKDFRRMVWAMPLVVCVLLVTMWKVALPSRSR
jgi:hypothetical protein